MRNLVLSLTILGWCAMFAAGDESAKKEPRKVASELNDRTPESIQKQVDFTKEHLLLFKWSGSGRDKLEFSVEEGKDGSVVVFKLTPGLTRDLRQHSRLFAVSKSAAFRVGDRVKEPAKITRAEDLPTYFPATKVK